MLKQFSVLFFAALIVLSSCHKDVKTSTSALNSTNNLNSNQNIFGTAMQVLDTGSHWYGDYAGYDGPYPTIPDSILIKDGVAKNPDISQPYEFSNIYYDIPSQYNITGDSITFEAKVKNRKEGSKNGYDVVLQLFGDQHNAQVQFVGVQEGLPYTQYFVGNARHTNLQPLVHYFDHFETVRLVMKYNSTAVYLDSVKVYQFKYGAENSIGRLQRINIAGKGRAVVTSADLRTSFGRKLILSEDFDIDGHSHTIYYNQ